MRRQGELIQDLSKLAQNIRIMKEPRLKKVFTHALRIGLSNLIPTLRLIFYEQKLPILKAHYSSLIQLHCHWSLTSKLQA